MLYLGLVSGGVLVGLLVGRWWVLVVAVGVALWIAAVSEVDEVPGWVLGAAYGVLVASGITLGVALRKWHRG